MSDNVINAEFGKEETRLFEWIDGTKVPITMSELHWWNVRFLFVVEGITERQISTWAHEELDLQPMLGLNEAVKGIVAVLSNQDRYWEEEISQKSSS